MNELEITVLSLVGGAILASFSGIFVTWWTDSRKERRQLKGFKLEFKLAVENLCNRLDEFEEIYKSKNVEKANEYISTPFIKDKIFYKYSTIAKISSIDIELYYSMIKELEDIDQHVGKPNLITLFRGDGTIKDVCTDNPIWEKLNDFMIVYFRDLKELMWSLD